MLNAVPGCDAGMREIGGAYLLSRPTIMHPAGFLGPNDGDASTERAEKKCFVGHDPQTVAVTVSQGRGPKTSGDSSRRRETRGAYGARTASSGNTLKSSVLKVQIR